MVLLWQVSFLVFPLHYRVFTAYKMLRRYFVFIRLLSGVLLFLSGGGAATAQNFSSATPYAVGQAPQGLAVSDVDSDSLVDILTVNSGANTVSILLNQAASPGTFKLAPVTLATGGSYPVALALADVNGDGEKDIIVANEKSSTITILRAAAIRGSFLQATAYASGGVAPRGVAVTDVNNDGQPDIVVAATGSNRISVLLNSSTTPGKFKPAVTYSSGGTRPEGLVLRDVDGDTRPDIVFSNQGSNTIGVLLNSSQVPGKFLPASTYPSGSTAPRGVALSDLNGDGRLDVASTNAETGSVAVLLNATIPGTFAKATTFTSDAANPIGIAIGDLNGDKQLDIVLADYATRLGNTIRILYNSPLAPGTFSTPALVYPSSGTGPHDILLHDFNDDGLLDIAITNLDSNTIGVLLNTGKF